MDIFVSTCIDKVDEHQNEICEIANDMQRGKYKVLDLVEELDSYLTASEVASRIKGCELLSSVLQKLSDDYLSSVELSHLADFLSAKLEDHYTLQPSVLQGLVKVSSAKLDKSHALTLINTLFKEVHVRSCLQNERYKVFQILSNVFDYQREAIISMGRDFVLNYIQAIDGEQDPRNLLVIFQLSSNLIKCGIDMGTLEEEFFDVASCYFPIDFNPSSAGKKTVITNQDLVLGLRSVLSASSSFSKYCIPLCLEKMESDIESAKLDAILTLTDCLASYSKRDLEPFLPSLWERLKQEITQVVSQEVEKSALNLLTQLVSNLSQWPHDTTTDTISDLNSFLSKVLSDCLPRLKEPIQDKLTWMSGLMLLSCAKGSKIAFKFISSAVLPLLLERADKLQSDPTPPSMTAAVPLLPTGMDTIVEYLVKLMTVCSTFSYSKDEHPFIENSTSVLSLLMNIIMKDFGAQTKCTAIVGIASMLKLDVLDKEDMMLLAGCFFSLSCSDIDKKLSFEILSATSFLASKHPLLVKSALLPKLFQAVPLDNFLTVPLSSVKKTFSFFPPVCVHIELLKEVVAYLLQLVNQCEIGETDSKFLDECMICLQKITQSCTSNHEYVDHLSDNVALPLIKMSVEASLAASSAENCCASCDPAEKFLNECTTSSFIKSVTIILRNICQKCKPGKAADSLLHSITDLYLNQDTSAVGIKTAKNFGFQPFTPNFSMLQSRTVCLLTSSICSFDRSFKILRVDDFMHNLLELALSSSDQPTYVAAAKSFSGLLNKYHKSCDRFIEKVIFDFRF